VQNKGFLLVANHAANLQTAKRPAVAERIDGFQHAGFAAAVRANQEVKAREIKRDPRFRCCESRGSTDG
jgi:hypothetical protein